MAELVRIEERDGVRVAVYDTGLERNADTGRIMKPAPGALITADNAKALQRKRQEKQREALQAALLAGVQRKDIVEKFGEHAWIWAIAESAMTKATTPDDPKAIEAARFVREWHKELSNENESNDADGAPRVFVLLAELRRRELDTSEVIDVESS